MASIESDSVDFRAVVVDRAVRRAVVIDRAVRRAVSFVWDKMVGAFASFSSADWEGGGNFDMVNEMNVATIYGMGSVVTTNGLPNDL